MSTCPSRASPSRAGGLLMLVVLSVMLLRAGWAGAEPSTPGAVALPDLGKAPTLAGLVGKKLVRIDVVVQGARWTKPVTLRRVSPGVPFAADHARLAMTELLDSGRYADA